jgi:UDP-N-acetylglucosamine 2-epimerase (non-hydrolysing)
MISTTENCFPISFTPRPHLLHVVGARPNFMKAAPVYRALASRGTHQTLVHTGQHYDTNMSEVFFQELGIPAPDQNLAVGSGSHAQQTAAVMASFEPVVLEYQPDTVLVYGDVNSTLAAALVCAKLGIPVAHVEAGLRSFDRTMPEEVNRLLTDQLSDLLFTPSEDANENLRREGIPSHKIQFVGNVMIDTLVRLLPKAIQTRVLDLPQPYGLLTLHRPSNVDDPQTLRPILDTLLDCSREIDILFPVHPRTRLRLLRYAFRTATTGKLHLLDPLPYSEFLGLQHGATFVVTDSGGIQEETTFLGVPCLTVRENTERPVTVTCGSNIVVGQDMERLVIEIRRILAGKSKVGKKPALWDGHAAERIADTLLLPRGRTLAVAAT